MTDPKDLAKSRRKLTRAGVRDAANVSFWGMAAYTVAQLIAMMFTQNLLGTAAIQSLVAELAAGKVGVAWSDPEAPIPSSKAIATRAGRGALAALVVASISIVAITFHGGSIVRGTFTIPAAALGLLTAGLTAMRDELLLRGIVIRAFKHLLPLPLLFLVCGLAGGAARMGDPDATNLEIIASAALGVIFASAWIIDRGAWLPWGAHAAWTFITSTLARGVILDAKSPSGGTLDTDFLVVGVLVVTALVAARFSASRAHPARIAARPES
ncbi:MAG: CPBP family glutamic-type intramembrane protease [Polyangiaceae bacterium]